MDTERDPYGPNPGPYPRPRETVLRELRDTQHRRLMIRAAWDEHNRQVEACRLQHKLAVDAIDALLAELDTVAVTPLRPAP